MYLQQHRKLAFVNNGATLLHSTQSPSEKSGAKNWRNTIVVAWDLKETQQHYICPGLLIGVSRDGSTFLTYQNAADFNSADDRFSAWDALTGKEISLKKIDPDSYELHQRIIISTTERTRRTLRITDIFEKYAPTPFLAYHNAPTSGVVVDSWAMAPNNQYIIVTYSGDQAGFDWASGESISIQSHKSNLIVGTEIHKFQVNRFQGYHPPINFSNKHPLVAISGSSGNFIVYDVNQWSELTKVWLDGFENIVDFNPRRNWIVAATTRQYIKETEEILFYIHLLDIKDLIGKGEFMAKGKEIGVLDEVGWVDHLLFHPNGRFLASLLENNDIHIWDINLGKIIAHLSL